MRYVLEPRAVVARARALAATGTALAVAPAWLVIVLVLQLGLATRGLAWAVGAAVAALGALRAVVTYRRAARRLAAIEIDDDDDGLTLRGVEGQFRLPRAMITRAVEIEGTYGGLRLDLAPGALTRRLDVPRGGDTFTELRARIAAWRPIERSARRGWRARAALVAGVVLAFFFVPFVVADARGSRLAAAVVLVAAWGATRVVLARA